MQSVVLQRHAARLVPSEQRHSVHSPLKRVLCSRAGAGAAHGARDGSKRGDLHVRRGFLGALFKG
jgi:hypothetical protein